MKRISGKQPGVSCQLCTGMEQSDIRVVGAKMHKPDRNFYSGFMQFKFEKTELNKYHLVMDCNGNMLRSIVLTALFNSGYSFQLRDGKKMFIEI